MINILNELGLTFQQAKILYSLQYELINNDIKHEKNTKTAKSKIEWRNKWKKSIEEYIKSIASNEEINIKTSFPNYDILYSMNEIGIRIEEEKKNLINFKTPLYLILLETTLFVPYYNLDKGNKVNLKMNDKEADALKCKFAELLGIPVVYVDNFKKSYKKAVMGITGNLKRIIIFSILGAAIAAITAGMAAPAIAAAVAAEGLTGAAAISAGLAALGGGAISAGGLGMAGGMAVIVGGGTILGASSGAGAGMLMRKSSDFTLTQAAKLEVVMKEIILTAQGDIRIIQEIIKNQQENIQKLEREVIQLKISKENNDKDIKELEKSIKYLKNELERMLKMGR